MQLHACGPPRTTKTKHAQKLLAEPYLWPTPSPTAIPRQKKKPHTHKIGARHFLLLSKSTKSYGSKTVHIPCHLKVLLKPSVRLHGEKNKRSRVGANTTAGSTTDCRVFTPSPPNPRPKLTSHPPPPSPVGMPHALRPAVPDVDLHVPAVSCVVRHLRRKVLSEPHALGVHANLQLHFARRQKPETEQNKAHTHACHNNNKKIEKDREKERERPPSKARDRTTTTHVNRQIEK